MHDTFHVSNLKKKKCLADASLHEPVGMIKVNRALRLSRNLLRLWSEMLRVGVW